MPLSAYTTLLKNGDIWKTMVDMQCGPEELEGRKEQVEPAFTLPLYSGQPGIILGFSLN